ncbi:MAG: adenylosuccinate lyase [Candidatus Omnitrophica bacterium]|nr:adenylosuccinate lyase [Candidatus Omnitrophota bacterium]
MIERYTNPEMGKIWTEQNKVQKWLDVELRALEALALYGYIPKNIPAKVRKKAGFNLKRIHEIEKVVNHDVIAFLTNLAEKVGPVGRYVHYGLTSSDILDTALAVQIKEATALLLKELKNLLKALRFQARKHRNTLMVGRSHGIHAEPTTFGLKMALFYEEFKRNLVRLERADETIGYGKISGAVGTFANVDPRVENYVCKKLGLKPDPISTQIVQRDRHAEYLSTLAVIGASLEKLGTEIRGLQKTETREVEEFFGKGQKGSSAMPHKRNPITCERVAGLARILRGNAVAALENVALWHERDITHSSVERVIFPDSTILLHYMLIKMTGVIEGLVVYKDKMLSNLGISRGMVFSQGLLLKLVNKGITREEAYKLVQDNAKAVWENPSLTLQDSVSKDAKILKHLKPREVKEVFDYRYHLKNVNSIFKRVGI